MAALIKLETPDGELIEFKVDEASGMLEPMGLPSGKKLKERLDTAFIDAVSIIEKVTGTFHSRMSKLGDDIKPDEFGIEFGVNIDSEVGAVFAQTSLGATFKVSAKWTTSKESADQDS